MEISGEVHTPGHFTGSKDRHEEYRWAPKPVWKFWRREKSLPLPE